MSLSNSYIYPPEDTCTSLTICYRLHVSITYMFLSITYDIVQKIHVSIYYMFLSITYDINYRLLSITCNILQKIHVPINYVNLSITCAYRLHSSINYV